MSRDSAQAYDHRRRRHQHPYQFHPHLHHRGSARHCRVWALEAAAAEEGVVPNQLALLSPQLQYWGVVATKLTLAGVQWQQLDSAQSWAVVRPPYSRLPQRGRRSWAAVGEAAEEHPAGVRSSVRSKPAPQVLKQVAVQLQSSRRLLVLGRCDDPHLHQQIQ